MKNIEGNLILNNENVAIVSARFNDFIVSKLHAGSVDCLTRHGLNKDNITEVWVPGAFELPLVAKKLADSGKFDAVICLGCVIRGATSHYDYVCNEAAKGITKAGMDSGVPVMFGVLTTESREQAVERAGTKAGNKGWEVTLGAIEMINLMKKIKEI